MTAKKIKINKGRISTLARKDVAKKYGFKHRDYANWIVKNGFLFSIQNCVLPYVWLYVKPLYVDDLFWDIFDMSSNKTEPMSLRVMGAFSVRGILLGDYKLELSDITEFTEDRCIEIWNDFFQQTVTPQIDLFLANNPDANSFIPIDDNIGSVLHSIILCHNRKIQEALDLVNREIAKGRTAGTVRMVIAFENGTYKTDLEYIRDYCIAELSKN